MAYRMLSEANPDIKVLIKPIGSLGHGSFAPSSTEELRFYDFPYGSVALQENVSQVGDRSSISTSVPFFHGTLIPGKPCERITMGSTTYGLRSCTADTSFGQDVENKAGKLLQALSPVGSGGFAFVSHNGEPVLTDIHVQAGIEHFTKLFHQMYGDNQAYASWSVVRAACRWHSCGCACCQQSLAAGLLTFHPRCAQEFLPEPDS